LPLILIMFALSRWAGRLVDKMGPRPPLVIGPLIAAAGFAAFTLPGTGGSYWTGFFPAIVVLGFGMTVTVAPLTTTVMNSVAPEAAGTASGVNNAVSRVAGLLAIAIFGSLMAWAFDNRMHDALQAARVPQDLVALVQGERSKLAAIELPAGLDPAHAAAIHHAVGDAFVAGFRWIMALGAGLALASAGVAALFIRTAAPPDRGLGAGGHKAYRDAQKEEPR
jgi:MFS family permease